MVRQGSRPEEAGGRVLGGDDGGESSTWALLYM